MGVRTNLQRLGFLLIGLGGLTIVGYLFYLLFTFFGSTRAIPLPLRIAIPAIIVGFVILFAVVLWDSIRKRRTEKFEGIDDE